MYPLWRSPIVFSAFLFSCLFSSAQAAPSGPPLATGKLKVLGSVSSSSQVTDFTHYWNAVTPENGGKWGSVEGTRDVMNWTELDSAYNLAKSNGYPFRMHTLIWGSQQPAWIATLSASEQRQEIEQWFAAVAARYPDIDYIDVVNEPLHAPPRSAAGAGNYLEALGGAGASGWEWVLQSFRLARLYFPRAQLVLNDYSIINDGTKTQQFLTIINLLKNEGLIDLIGEQAHAFTTKNASVGTMTANLNALAATGLPLWMTELDIDGATDAIQLAEYQRVFPLLWEHPSIVGITMWGFRPGLWRNTEGAYLVQADGTERSALVWLRGYIEASTPPVIAKITAQPANQVASSGTTATFSVGATGNPAPTYQWQKSGVNIAGATSSSYVIASAAAGDAGTYSVLVTNTGRTITSNAATLTVTTLTAAPAITIQPISRNVVAGASVTFTASASGVPAPTFQWFKNGISISGATNASLTLSNVSVVDAATYQLVATNASGSATSDGATLTVNLLPVFTTQPLSNAAFVGGSVSMICAVSGTPAPTYQWQKGGIDIPGATNSTLTLNNIQLSDAGSYGLVATNVNGSATSRFSRLVVLVSQQNAITYATTRSSTGVTAGGIVNFDYFVTNVGTKTWGAHHYLSIRDVNNTFVAFSSLVGILPGETTTANLNFPAPTTPGSYTYYVQGLEDGVEFFSTQTTVVLTVLAPVTNAITYNTTSFPVSAAPGSNVIFTYNVTNTGTTTWGANHILSLKNGSGTVISSTPLTVLAPGASKTVNLSFTVPSTPGSYNYTVQASQTGVGNFGTQANLTLVALAPQPNAIVYNRVRYPDEVVPGAVLNLKYTLSNAGTQAWGSGHYVSLRDSNESYLTFIPLIGTSAGGTKTVEFTLTAPTTPGTYTYYVQALEDGIEFFSTQDVVILKVVALPLGNAISYNTSTIPVTAAPGATVNFTANVTNRGTRTWGATHYLSFRDVDDTFLAFPSLSGVTPGASRTANLSFVAPSTPGIYTYTLQAFEDGVSFFQMADTVVLSVQ